MVSDLDLSVSFCVSKPQDRLDEVCAGMCPALLDETQMSRHPSRCECSSVDCSV